ncbi:semaphorin-7A isoform X2 [Oryzias melastigma]|nr:semaphorin-7A isoform X2 [Oryzias melastigma]
MVFKETESFIKRFPLTGHDKPVKIIAETQPDTITSVGQTHLMIFNFKNSEKIVAEQKVVWEDCSDKGCRYNITVANQRNGGGSAFVCGSSHEETNCCEMDITANPLEARCSPSQELQHIKQSIKGFVTKEGEHSIFVKSGNNASLSLYMTSSGNGENVGIYRFGKQKLAPHSHSNEQHFVGLMLSKRENSLQDRIYTFYKQKNKDTALDSDKWIPFVSQVCTADIGGRKNLLQNKWTSMMNARLFCGDPERKQYFSELLDVNIVDADRWEETKVYALFRNEWGVSAVCMYTVADIHKVFMKSPFKEPQTKRQPDRPRECVLESSKISTAILNNIKEVSEMEEWVKPVKNHLPLLVHRHNYTGIHVDASQHSSNTVIFLSLANGGIHKVLQSEKDTFLISEYRPFHHHAHISSFFLHTPTRKLYVTSHREVVEVDVVNCERYGNSCEDCILSRDPYCSWSNNQCAEKRSFQQDMIRGNQGGCPQSRFHSTGENSPIVLPSGSRYFLRCPVSSLHAEYVWKTPSSSKSCSPKEDECLLLIESMSSLQDGGYECTSEEQGYRKVVAQYQLMSTAPGRTAPSGFTWVCVAAALMGRFSW